MKLVYLIIYTLLITGNSFGQAATQFDTLTNESLAEKFELYNKTHSSAILFLHTDKTLYTNNEPIWFRAYLISKMNDSFPDHNVLSIALVSENSRKVVLQAKYLFESGNGSGNLLLPDTIESGHYLLLAYTNKVDEHTKPVAVFTQSIVIKNIQQYSNTKNAKSPDTALHSNALNSSKRISPISTDLDIQPETTNNNIFIKLDEAVINDTIRFAISCTQNRKLKILIHNYRQGYAFFNVDVHPKEQFITVALEHMPKGIAAICILDTLGNLLTERLFFAHYDHKINVMVNTGKQQYQPKEKITVNIKLTDESGLPVQGLVSVACVQSNRIQSNLKQDIESTIYLKDDLGLLPGLNGNSGTASKIYIENLLLAKGWGKHKWSDLMNTNSIKTFGEDHSLTFTGSVTKLDQPLKKPVSLTIVNDSAVKLISTNDMGLFTIQHEDLETRNNKKIWMILNQKNTEGYTININDPYTVMNDKIATELKFEPLDNLTNQQLDSVQIISNFKNSKTLTNIVIKAKHNYNPFVIQRDVHGFNTNACGDYACAMYDDLNCTLSFHDLNNTIVPIKGKMYYKLVFDDHGRLIWRFPEEYRGCSLEEYNKTSISYLPSINTPTHFIGADYDLPDSPPEQYLSTVYWNPAIAVNNGLATFSFTASDLQGKFDLIVQGISLNDVLYGESSFFVKKL